MALIFAGHRWESGIINKLWGFRKGLFCLHFCVGEVNSAFVVLYDVVVVDNGSRITSSFFYAHLENTELSEFVSGDSALLRLVDDFLYITPDLEMARKFLKRMSGGLWFSPGAVFGFKVSNIYSMSLLGFPLYGCSVNMDKTLVNFETDVAMGRVRNLGEETNGMKFVCYRIFNYAGGC